MSPLPRLTAVETVILDLLEEREMYGLEMVEASSGRLASNSGMYLALARMSRNGLVASRLRNGMGQGPARRVYRATRKGQRIHSAWRAYRDALNSTSSEATQ